MTAPVSSLPSRPSLESLRKQAKKLTRDVAVGDADVLTRVRAQLEAWEPPLSQRDAQLVIAREYGFAGWQDLREEVLKRLGQGLEWAAGQAQRAIHDNDVERLKVLITEFPALLSWRDDDGLVLMHATTAFAMDVSDPAREAQFYRPDCAALLIDAGAVVDRPVWELVTGRGANGMLKLFEEKGVLPHTLPVLAALGDFDGVRASLADADPATVNQAFMNACRFKHKDVATLLLDRAVALDSEFGREVDQWKGREAFVDSLIEHYPSEGARERGVTPWRAFVTFRLVEAMDEDDLEAFTRWLETRPWLLDEASLPLQVELLEQAAIKDRGPFIRALLDRDPAILHAATPPRSGALIFAMEYGYARLVPELMRVWPLPDDLPHAAGIGNLARVEAWFDTDGKPALGELSHHNPANNPTARKNLHWGAPSVQQVLDMALAWACVNKHFDVASFLLQHGADINTTWSTHEPASILHECAVQGNYEAAEFLVENGIDLTIRDYRWNATAAGWAYNAAKDVKMTKFLVEAEQKAPRKSS